MPVKLVVIDVCILYDTVYIQERFCLFVSRDLVYVTVWARTERKDFEKKIWSFSAVKPLPGRDIKV